MEVRLTPAIEQVIPPQISFNFEEIKSELAGKLQVYQSMVVTESGIKEAKADRANLNKFKAALADSRKAVKAQWNQPLCDFESKMKELERMVDEPIGAIDRQVKAYDEAKKQDKRQQIERFFEGAVGDLEEVLPLSKIWNDRWLNATYPMKDIERYVYACVAHRRCAICGQKAEIHEVERVGMGRDRRKIHHLGQLVEPLCRQHHAEVDQLGQKSFDEKYHLQGIRLDEQLCRILKWRK